MLNTATNSKHPQGLKFTCMQLIFCDTCGDTCATMQHSKERILNNDTSIRTTVLRVCFSCFVDKF